MVGKGRGEDGGGSLLCAGGCQPEGHRERGEETWGSWWVVRAGRPAVFVLLSVCPQERLVCGISGPVCIVLRFKGQSGGAALGEDLVGSRPQNRTCGLWCGGEPLSHQRLFLASGVYF